MYGIFLILLTMLLNQSCGVPHIGPSPSAELAVDSQFDQYVEEFEARTGHQVVHLYMHFEDHLDGDTIGECYPSMSLGLTKEIRIDRSWWLENPEVDYRKIVVFHELAHCFMDKEHTNTCFDDDGAPTSIMHPNLTPVKEAWSTRSEWYIEELFGDGHTEERVHECTPEELGEE